MKKIASFAEFAIYLLGCLMTPISRICVHAYTIYLIQHEAHRFKKCGNNFKLKPPIYMSNEKYMEIGNHFRAKPGLRLECIGKYSGKSYTPQLIIGDNVSFNYYCHVGCMNRIVIGSNVMFGSHVLVEDHSHGMTGNLKIPIAKRELSSKGPIIIGDNVWVGDNVCILENVIIGMCSVIGANSVVTHDIPPYSVAVGAPAKVIKTLSH